MDPHADWFRHVGQHYWNLRSFPDAQRAFRRQAVVEAARRLGPIDAYDDGWAFFERVVAAAIGEGPAP